MAFDLGSVADAQIRSVLYVPKMIYTKHTVFNGTLSSYELVYYFAGSRIANYNGKTLNLMPDCVEYLPRGIAGATYEVEPVEPGACADIYFLTSTPLPTEALMMPLRPENKIRGKFSRMMTLWQFRQEGYMNECLSLFFGILAELEREAKKVYVPAEKFACLAGAEAYIRSDCFRQNFDFSCLPSLCGIGYTYFLQLFVAKYGVTPVAYVTRLRMTYAADLLSAGYRKITNVAEATGYSSVYYFSRVFGKTFGVTPTAYRQGVRQPASE